MLSTVSKTEITIFVLFHLSSAKCFQFGLVQYLVIWEWVKCLYILQSVILTLRLIHVSHGQFATKKSHLLSNEPYVFKTQNNHHFLLFPQCFLHIQIQVYNQAKPICHPRNSVESNNTKFCHLVNLTDLNFQQSGPCIV